MQSNKWSSRVIRFKRMKFLSIQKADCHLCTRFTYRIFRTDSNKGNTEKEETIRRQIWQTSMGRYMKRLLMVMTFLGLKLPPPPLTPGRPTQRAGSEPRSQPVPCVPPGVQNAHSHHVECRFRSAAAANLATHTYKHVTHETQEWYKSNANTENLKYYNVPWIVGHFRRWSSSHTLLGLRLHYELYFDSLLQNYD
jgi:hypothetical protein